MWEDIEHAQLAVESLKQAAKHDRDFEPALAAMRAYVARRLVGVTPRDPEEPTETPAQTYSDIEAVLQTAIRRALRESDGNLAKAARLMGCKRTTLIERIRRRPALQAFLDALRNDSGMPDFRDSARFER